MRVYVCFNEFGMEFGVRSREVAYTIYWPRKHIFLATCEANIFVLGKLNTWMLLSQWPYTTMTIASTDSVQT